MDFGIAKISDGKRMSLTGMQVIVGTPYYSAPEQVRSQRDRIKPSTDVYAAGITLYEILTKELPFDAASEFDVLRMQVDQQLPQHAIIDKKLFKIIRKATEKDQAKRYQSARDFLVDISSYKAQKYRKEVAYGAASSVNELTTELEKTSSYKLVYFLVAGMLIFAVSTAFYGVRSFNLSQELKFEREKVERRDSEIADLHRQRATNAAQIDVLEDQLEDMESFRDRVESQNFVIGPSNVSPSGYDTGYNFHFKVLHPVKLRYVSVKPNKSGTLTIRIHDSSGDFVSTFTKSVTGDMWNSCYLNVALEKRGDYRMSYSGNVKLSWHRESRIERFNNNGQIKFMGCSNSTNPPSSNQYYQYFYAWSYAFISG